MSAETAAFSLRRTNGTPRDRSRSATTAKRCGCRGTMTRSEPAGIGIRAMASRMSAFLAVAGAGGHPDRTGRAESQPEFGTERQRVVGNADVVLQVARDYGAGAPSSARRAASAGDCAATPRNRC